MGPLICRKDRPIIKRSNSYPGYLQFSGSSEDSLLSAKSSLKAREAGCMARPPLAGTSATCWHMLRHQVTALQWWQDGAPQEYGALELEDAR